jgi:tetratricopeptide (TPR) repeat protein
LLVLALVLGTLAGTAAAQPAESRRKPPSRDTAAVERRLIATVHRSPDSFDAHRALAAFYLRDGQLDAAIPHLERAQAIDPTHYANGYDLAVAWLETGKLEHAREHIRRMLGARETGELHNLLGDIEERAGNLAGASEEYQRAAHMDPTEEHLFDWGNNLVQLRAFEPATEVFTAALTRHPRSARLHVGLGIAQYSRGRYQDAVKSFCQAADLSPLDPRPYQFLGEMYGVVPELAGEVTRRLARFVKAQPANALAHYHYALSLWKGQPAALPPAERRRVEALLRRAVALDPTLTKGFLELGILLSDQRRFTEAIQPLRTATRLEPGLAQAHYRLAQAYQRTGQPALAAKELEIFEQIKASEKKDEGSGTSESHPAFQLPAPSFQLLIRSSP